MKRIEDYLLCPWKQDIKCGDHVGYCPHCRKSGRLTVADKIAITIVTLFIALMCLLSGCDRPATTHAASQVDDLPEAYSGAPVELFKVEGCWYVGVYNYGLEHAGNCPNPIHEKK